MAKKFIKSDLHEALSLCKGAFLSAAGFSLVINFYSLNIIILFIPKPLEVTPHHSQGLLPRV
jgi:hypothetical protein